MDFTGKKKQKKQKTKKQKQKNKTKKPPAIPANSRSVQFFMEINQQVIVLCFTFDSQV